MAGAGPDFDDVIHMFGAGRLSAGQAFSMLHTTTPGGAAGPGSSPPPPPTGAPSGESKDGDEAERRRRLDDVMRELNSLIGLHSVKQVVLELQAFVEIQRLRAQHGLAADKTALHMIFKGNPGTGKTTVARVLGRMFREMNALSKGHLVECERADLVGEYIGHTAQRTRERIRKSLGGILFVDEAYSLARGGEKDFGKEAIDTLVKSMEDHKDELIVILAGYPAEMDWFLASNPGLRSRFPMHIDFPDYTTGELLAIAEFMCAQRQYRLSPGARRRLAQGLEATARTSSDGNARYVRNVLERAMRRQALRLVSRRRLTKDELMTLQASDLGDVTAGFTTERPGPDPLQRSAAGEALARLVRSLGMDGETELTAG